MDQPYRKPVAIVVGARHGSLGDHIVTSLQAAETEVTVYRAGLATEEVHLDATDYDRAVEVFRQLEPTHVVCTVGRNQGGPVYGDDWAGLAEDLMAVNYLAPMKLLAAFEWYLDGMPGTFVAVSSNSAHIARSSSAAYCASKAALSMGLRCAARDFSRAGKPLRVWGYEPGALLGTPMTKAVARGLGSDVAMSRMLTNPAGLPVAAVARTVARDLLDASDVLHGTMVRLDNGEQ